MVDLPQETLRGKNERIDEMARLTSQSTRCFRAELIEALAGPGTAARRPLALRILDWAFSENTQVRKADVCCDVCNPELATQLRAGTYGSGERRGAIGKLRPQGLKRFGGTRRVVAALAAGLAVLGVIALSSGSPSDADQDAVARDTFKRYTAAFADSGEFTDITVRPGATPRTCGRYTRDGRAESGRYTLCLLIDVARPAGQRVTGSFKTTASRGRHDCHGAARTERLCG